MKNSVLVVTPFHERYVKALESLDLDINFVGCSDNNDCPDDLSTYEVGVAWKIDPLLLKRWETLKWVQMVSAGADEMLDTLSKREDVVITSVFQHNSWFPDNVTFSDGASEETGSFTIETFGAGTTQQITASVTVGYGVQVDYPEVPVTFNADSGSSTIGSTDVVLVVTNWIAYESSKILEIPRNS